MKKMNNKQKSDQDKINNVPPTARHAYHNHKNHAKNRGIPFNFSFDEWFKLWTDSGKLHQRGNRRGQWSMSRINKDGGFDRDNVEIVRNERLPKTRIDYKTEPPEHATINRYINYGCRCQLCRLAWNQYHRQWEATKRINNSLLMDNA